MPRYWKSINTILYTIAHLLSSTTMASEQYVCECCGKYITNVGAPRVAGNLSKISNEKLFKAERYGDIVKKFEASYRRDSYSKDDIGWWSEALYALGQIKTGRPDPNRGPMFFVGEEPEDPIAHDLWWLHERFRRRNWDKTTVEQYGNAAICGISEYRVEKPRFWGYYARYITLLIASGRYEDVLQEVKAIRKGSLEIDETPGEFLAIFLEQYVGAALYEQGARYLVTLKQTQGLKPKTEKYWKKMLLRGVESEEIKRSKKDALKATVSRILND